MTLLNDGKNRIRDLIESDLENGQYGTGTTEETPDDTGLETAVASSEKAVTTSITDKQIVIDHNLASTDSNGEILTEFVVFLNGGTDVLSRVTLPSFTKSNDEQWQTTTIFVIE